MRKQLTTKQKAEELRTSKAIKRWFKMANKGEIPTTSYIVQDDGSIKRDE